MSERRAALRPTEPATLVVAALVAAAVAWLLIRGFYQQLPPMIWPPVILIGGIAALEAAIAMQLWGRIHGRGPVAAGARRQGRPLEPVDPLAVVRYAVLAKASTMAGAILAGAYAGFLPWLAIEATRLTGAAADLPPTVGGLVASGALVASGWWLERSCRVPEPDQPEREPQRGEQPADRPGDEPGPTDS